MGPLLVVEAGREGRLVDRARQLPVRTVNTLLQTHKSLIGKIFQTMCPTKKSIKSLLRTVWGKPLQQHLFFFLGSCPLMVMIGMIVHFNQRSKQTTLGLSINIHQSIKQCILNHCHSSFINISLNLAISINQYI